MAETIEAAPEATETRSFLGVRERRDAVADRLRQAIRPGKLVPGQRVPTELSLTEEYQLSRLTVAPKETPMVRYEEYVIATALTLARRHRPVWSWQRWRRICRCGAELPCHAKHRIPINRGHWPGEGR